MGVFAASGVGKTTLLHQVTQGSKVDVVVLCLVGERGREVGEFVERLRSAEPAHHAEASPWVVVASTPDQPALARMRCLFTATALAESYRDQGLDVLLLVDSLTKFARASRDVGLAAGEIPATRGYPASVFGYISSLIERTGNGQTGSITAFYTLLVDEDSVFDPIAEESRACFDGHIILSRSLADEGIWPAIDITRSVSRPMNQIVEPEHAYAASRVRKSISHRNAKQELVDIGAYRRGTDPFLDSTLDSSSTLRLFRTQSSGEITSWAETLSRLYSLSEGLVDGDNATVPERT
jgi:FliI/YscN family ATPase